MKNSIGRKILASFLSFLISGGPALGRTVKPSVFAKIVPEPTHSHKVCTNGSCGERTDDAPSNGSKIRSEAPSNPKSSLDPIADLAALNARTKAEDDFKAARKEYISKQLNERMAKNQSTEACKAAVAAAEADAAYKEAEAKAKVPAAGKPGEKQTSTDENAPANAEEPVARADADKAEQAKNAAAQVRATAAEAESKRQIEVKGKADAIGKKMETPADTTGKTPAAAVADKKDAAPVISKEQQEKISADLGELANQICSKEDFDAALKAYEGFYAKMDAANGGATLAAKSDCASCKGGGKAGGCSSCGGEGPGGGGGGGGGQEDQNQQNQMAGMGGGAGSGGGGQQSSSKSKGEQLKMPDFKDMKMAETKEFKGSAPLPESSDKVLAMIADIGKNSSATPTASVAPVASQPSAANTLLSNAIASSTTARPATVGVKKSQPTQRTSSARSLASSSSSGSRRPTSSRSSGLRVVPGGSRYGVTR